MARVAAGAGAKWGKAGAFDDLTDEELVALAALAARKARELAFAGPREVEDDNNNKKSP